MARIERATRNGQTLRLDTEQDEVKFSILKQDHFRGIAKISPSDAVDFAKAILAEFGGDDA